MHFAVFAFYNIKRKKRNNRNIRITCVIASTNTKIIIDYHLKVV